MPTVLEIIDQALEHLEIKGAGETTSAEDSASCLRALVSFLDSLQLDPLAIIGLRELVFTPLAGAQSVTIGEILGTDIAARAPSGIHNSSFYRLNGLDTLLPLANESSQYTERSPKDLIGLPSLTLYERTPTVGTLRLWPASDGSYELHIKTALEIVTGQSDLAITDFLILPPGYQTMLEYGLASEVALRFNRDKKIPILTARFLRALKRIKRTNFQSPQISTPVLDQFCFPAVIR